MPRCYSPVFGSTHFFMARNNARGSGPLSACDLRRRQIEMRVNNQCVLAAGLSAPPGIPIRKWKKAIKTYSQRLKEVVKKMNKFDNASLNYFEGRIDKKTAGGAEAAVTRVLHKFVGV